MNKCKTKLKVNTSLPKNLTKILELVKSLNAPYSISEQEKKPPLKGILCFATVALNLIFTSNEFILRKKLSSKYHSSTSKTVLSQDSDLLTLLTTKTKFVKDVDLTAPTSSCLAESPKHLEFITQKDQTSYLLNLVKYVDILAIVCDDTKLPKIPLLQRNEIPNNQFTRDLEIIQMNADLRVTYKSFLSCEMVKLEYQFISCNDDDDDDDNTSSNRYFTHNNDASVEEKITSLGYTFSSNCSPAYCKSLLSVIKKAHQLAEYIKLTRILQMNFGQNLRLGIIRLVEEIFTMIFESHLPFQSHMNVVRNELRLITSLAPSISTSIQTLVKNQLSVYPEPITKQHRDEQINNTNPSPIILVSLIENTNFIGNPILNETELKYLSGDTESELFSKSFLSEIPNFLACETTMQDCAENGKEMKQPIKNMLQYELKCEEHHSFVRFRRLMYKSSFLLPQNRDNVIMMITNPTPIPDHAVKKLKKTLPRKKL